MANEGSTKPDAAFDEICRLQRLTESQAADLARVRGLLQRQWISVEERLPEVSDMYTVAAKPAPTNQVSAEIDVFSAVWEDDVLPGQKPLWLNIGDEWIVTHWQPQPDPPTFPQSSSLVPSGAESADIGKLDTVDGKAIDEQFAGMATDEKYQAETLKIEKDFAQSDWEALQAGADKSGVEMGKVSRVDEK